MWHESSHLVLSQKVFIVGSKYQTHKANIKGNVTEHEQTHGPKNRFTILKSDPQLVYSCLSCAGRPALVVAMKSNCQLKMHGKNLKMKGKATDNYSHAVSAPAREQTCYTTVHTTSAIHTFSELLKSTCEPLNEGKIVAYDSFSFV